MYKALATITVWVLFIFGALALLGGFGRIIMGTMELDLITAYFGFGAGGMFLSLVAMNLRQKMD